MPSNPDGAAPKPSLGEQLTRRRMDLDSRYRNRQVFADERGVEYRTVSKIENNESTRFRRATITGLEAAYELPVGAIARALADGAAVLPELPDHEPESREARIGPLYGESVDETRLTPYLNKVQALFIDATVRTGLADPPAAEIFGEDGDRGEIAWWEGAARVVEVTGEPVVDVPSRVRRTAVRRMKAAARRATGLHNDFVTGCWSCGTFGLIPGGANADIPACNGPVADG